MKSMGMVAWGFVIACVDIRVGLDHLDVLPDLLGWLICAAGLYQAHRVYVSFDLAGVAAVCAAAASAPSFLGTPPSSLLSLVQEGLSLVVLLATCTGIVRVAPDRAAVRTAKSIRWLTLAFCVGILGLYLVPDVALGVMLAVGILATGAWFVLFLFRLQRLPAPAPRAAVAR